MFEVEALRDGRLGGSERRSFERHLVGCPACAREAQALDRLAQAARVGLGEIRGPDELHDWRARNRLLVEFDRALVSSGRSPLARRWLLWPAAVAVLGAALLALWRARPAVEPVQASRASIRADGATVWSRRAGAGDREEITLERGLLWIRVDHAVPGRRLVVALPDGELEDVGTTFTVSANGEHTTRVVVEEGRVVLRLRGRPSVDVVPGEAWSPRPPPALVPLVAPPSAEPPRQDTGHAPQRASRPIRARPTEVADVADPLVDFRAASGALRAGDNRRAATAFARFLGEHPRDPMAEDAAYLRVIALQRMGADVDMKRAAEEYLRRFPTGFRHAEIERLAR
jgi:hypothetical protein